MITESNNDVFGVASHALFGIFQWGDLKRSGTKEDCECLAKRWTEQNGNLDLEVILLPNDQVELPPKGSSESK